MDIGGKLGLLLAPTGIVTLIVAYIKSRRFRRYEPHRNTESTGTFNDPWMMRTQSGSAMREGGLKRN